MKILVINGPNLNLLGTREPDIYGSQSLDDLMKELRIMAKSSQIELDDFQSNHEGALIDRIQQAIVDKIDGIIINPGGLSHTSIALHDALLAFKGNIIEVHLSHTLKREHFRQKKVTAPAADGMILGLGFNSYKLALYYFAQIKGGA